MVNDMRVIFIVLLILIIVVCLIVYTLLTYNKLILLRNETSKTWDNALEAIKRRFELVNQYIIVIAPYVDETLLNSVNNLYNSFINMDKREDIIKCSVTLEKTLKQITIILEDKNIILNDWNKAILDSYESLTKAKINYNDYALKLCDKINMFPSNIIASICGFTKWEYFISEE